MLLETLDVKSDDIVIYSKNKFDFHNNFKIIRKKDKIKQPQSITYFGVCEFVKNPSPKNLLVYRLLTSITNVDAFSSKYGFFIKVQDRMEVIYFDPIFALADLKHLNFDLDPDRFRFKIQQVGLQSMMGNAAEPVFTEVYSFDLKANEAKNQNDKIFADAIFALDDSYVNNDEDDVQELASRMNSRTSMTDLKFDKSEINPVDDVVEEKKYDSKKLTTFNIKEEKQAINVREKKILLLKNALGIKENEDAAFSIKKTVENEAAKVPEDKGSRNLKDIIAEEKILSVTRERVEEENINIMDLFKTTAKFGESLKSRQKESFILKIKNK
ncbi:MAG: hypothetical protein V1720_12660 [bacterium]